MNRAIRIIAVCAVVALGACKSNENEAEAPNATEGSGAPTAAAAEGAEHQAGEAEAPSDAPADPVAAVAAAAANVVAPGAPAATAVTGALPIQQASVLPAGAQAYLLVDVDAFFEQAAAISPGVADADAMRAAIAEHIGRMANSPEVPEVLRGRIHPERAHAFVGAVWDGQDDGEDSFIFLTDPEVLDRAPADGGPTETIDDDVQVAVRGGQLVVGEGPVFEAFLAGNAGPGFDGATDWPAGWAKLPEGAAVAAYVPEQPEGTDLPDEWTEMGLRRVLAAGGPSGRSVVAIDVEDDTKVRHFLGSAQRAVDSQLEQLRPMAPPFLQGWLSYIELVNRALWAQVSLDREGTITTLSVAAPRCGAGGGAIYALAALAWIGANEGEELQPVAFQPVEQRIADDCAPIPGPAPNLPRRFAGMAGTDISGEQVLVLADIGGLLRANLTTFFHLLPFALHPDDVTEAMGPTPLGMAGLADPNGLLAVYANIGNPPSGAGVLPAGARGFLPIPVPPELVSEVVEDVGWVIAMPGMGAAPMRALDDTAPWARLEAALPEDAVLGVFGTRGTLDDLLSELPDDSRLVAESKLLAVSLTADLNIAFAFFVGADAPAVATATDADIERYLAEAAAEMDDAEAEALQALFAPVRDALVVEAVGADVVRIRLGRTGVQGRSLLVAGAVAAVAMREMAGGGSGPAEAPMPLEVTAPGSPGGPTGEPKPPRP